jgi:hypothetical protein
MGRPRPILGMSDPVFGGDDLVLWNAYEIKWSVRKWFLNNPKGSLSYFQKMIEELEDKDIVWEPYIKFLDCRQTLCVQLLQQTRIFNLLGYT